jgi:hypothetical protein
LPSGNVAETRVAGRPLTVVGLLVFVPRMLLGDGVPAMGAGGCGKLVPQLLA